MKTLMDKIKFGALLTGLIFMSSCSGNATFTPAADQSSGSKELSYINSEGGQVEKSNFDKSSLKINQVAELTKRGVQAGKIINALPISFGPVDVTLVLN
jgi:hypothetical protein